MSTTNATQEWAAKARIALQIAVHEWNAHQEHPIALRWSSVGDSGILDYHDCTVMFAVTEPEGPLSPTINIFELLEPTDLPTDPRNLYNGLQTVCLYGVVPMFSPHPDRERILLEGVSCGIVANEIQGHSIVDAIFRVTMASEAFSQPRHHEFWTKHRK